MNIPQITIAPKMKKLPTITQNQYSISFKRCLMFILMLANLQIFSQTYPIAEPNTATYGSYVAPNGFPEYLQWFDADLSDSRIMRISDREVFGTTGQNLRHNYVLDQTWNSDETLIKLAGYPAAILDAETYELLYWSDIPSYGRWANTQPHIVYGRSGNTFVAHDVTTNSRTVLRTFTEYASIDFGYGKGNQDNNDRYVGLIGKNGNEETLIVYDIQNDYIYATYEAENVRWFTVSQNGNYCVVGYDVNGTGSAQGIRAYNLDFTNEVFIASDTPHGDVGIDINGNEVYVGYGNQTQWNDQHSLFMARLDGGGITNLFPYVNGLGIWGGHISCRNINRPGWAYVSEQCCPDNPVAPREVFAIKLDGSGTVERYAKHDNVHIPIFHSAQYVPNRNGTKGIFASNRGHEAEMQEYAATSFVLEVNQETLSTPQEIRVVEKPIKTYYFDIAGKSLKTLKGAAHGIYIVKRVYKNKVVNAKILRD